MFMQDEAQTSWITSQKSPKQFREKESKDTDQQ